MCDLKNFTGDPMGDFITLLILARGLLGLRGLAGGEGGVVEEAF